MKTYQIINREEPMVDGKVCNAVTACAIQADGKRSVTDVIRIQGAGPLSDALGHTGDMISIDVVSMPPSPGPLNQSA